VKAKRLKAIREFLGRPGMSAGDIGRHALDYFMENEGINE